MKKINFIYVAGNPKIDNTCSSSISILYLYNTMNVMCLHLLHVLSTCQVISHQRQSWIRWLSTSNFLLYSKLAWIEVMVFNATFNNISVISWRSVLLVEETGENHQPVTSQWQTLSHYVVLSTPRLGGIQTHNVRW